MFEKKKKVSYLVRFWDCEEPLSDKYNVETTDINVARAAKERYVAIDPSYAAVIFKVEVEAIDCDETLSDKFRIKVEAIGG